MIQLETSLLKRSPEFLHAIVPVLTANNISVLLELTVGVEIQLTQSHWKA